MLGMRKFKYIAFDADDTLWVNEPFFREKEGEFCELLKNFGDKNNLIKELYQTEIDNIKFYGYGIKGFALSMIETAIRVSKGKIAAADLQHITHMGKEMLNKPVVLLDGAARILKELNESGYKLIVATKGDLLDQERKLQKSELEPFFHHIEIMSDKKEANYLKLLAHLEVHPSDFLMVGNSLKSDILPVLNLGGYAVHIPFHTTWVHEHVEDVGELSNFWEIDEISRLHDILNA
jgi:putative hydrolase of the HAD superfamily